MSRRDPRDPYDGGRSSFGDPEPRWREDAPVDEAGRGRGADGWPPPAPSHRGAPRDGPAPGYDEPPAAAPGRSVFADVAPGPATYDDAYGDDPYGDEVDDGYGADGYEAAEGYGGEYDDYYEADPRAGYGHEGPVYPGDPRRPGRGRGSHAGSRGPAGPSSDRDMRTAVAVGVGFAVLALALFYFAGPLGAMLLVVPVLTYAAYEFFVAVHQAGFQPLLPVGVVATAGAVLGAYNYGEQAIPLVLVLTAAVCMLWYLVNAGGDRPTANIGVTLLGVVWIGVFGSFAGLLLSVPTHGVAFLLAAVIPTVAYDVGGLFVGRSAGSRALSVASPNKTIEGLAGGMFMAVVAGVVFAVIGVTPFSGAGDGLKIGLVAAAAAPIGDLAESLLKRDLDIKDMGTILPGHGGILDRFDAMLFVLPAIWYLARLSDFFVH